MQQLAQDINNKTFAHCYLLYGSEAYLRRQYRDRLKSALIDPADSMNFNYYSGKEINVGALIDQAETMPFFADRRVILIENPEFNKEDGEKLAAYLAEQAESTVIMLVTESIDKRSKLYKAFTKCGRVTEFTEQTPDTLTRWILGRVKKENKQIDRSAVELLLKCTGSDMSVIDIELEKLFSYTMDKSSINSADVEAIVTVSTSARVFDMTKAMAFKKQKVALDMYYDLLSHKESPFGILALIARQFNQMLIVKELIDDGMGTDAIAKKMNLWPKLILEYKSQADKFTFKRLHQALEACVRADEDVKAGRMTPEMAVELLIIEYSKA